MPRRRAIETRERDARAVELRRRHLNYQQIATEMGWASPSAACQSVQRGLADMAQEPSAEVRQMELDRLDDIARGFQRIFATRHYVVSVGAGKVVMDPAKPGVPLVDDSPVIQAGLALLRVMERRAKYLGLDAPTKSRVEVITEDVIDAEVAMLARQVAENDAAAAGSRTA
jgi:hypothetical protein